MKKTLNSLFILVAAILLSGCASNLMKPSSSAQLSQPSPGKARVVFMRTSFVASAIGVEMFDATGGELKFIGQLPMGNKIVYETTPGDKVFMAYGTAADFMLAKLAGGRTYYAIVRPNWATGGFAPTPISRADMKGKEFNEWNSGTELIEMKEKDAQAWFAENTAKYQEIYNKYWQRFQTKTPSQKAQRTLVPQDGIIQ